jgi:hypothetical protein
MMDGVAGFAMVLLMVAAVVIGLVVMKADIERQETAQAKIEYQSQLAQQAHDERMYQMWSVSMAAFLGASQVPLTILAGLLAILVFAAFVVWYSQRNGQRVVVLKPGQRVVWEEDRNNTPY